MDRSSQWRRWGNGYLYVSLTVLATFWMLDGLTVYRPPAAAGAGAPLSVPARGGRVFILLLDSLRYETATSPQLMPHLAALRARAVSAKVKPSYNAVTVPCLRAAFTGRDEVSVLGFVQNLLHGDAAIESVFSQFAAAGGRTAAFSDGSFRQFGAAIAPSFETSLMIHSVGVEDHDDDAVRRGLALFKEKGPDVVIVHVRYSDYAAHRFGVGAPAYGADFQRVDRLVGLAAEAVAPPDTLLVMGDHGHSPDGSHSLGQDVPTYALWRGPRLRPGLDLGTIDITSHRFFLSELLGVPLPAEGYQGGRYPSAFAGAGPAKDVVAGVSETVLRPVPLALWLYLSLLMAAGAGLLWPERAPWMRAPGAAVIVWLALPAAALPLPWNAWAGAAVALATFAWLLRAEPGRAWLGAVLAVTLAAGWHLWGRLLAAVREALHVVTRGQLACAWLLIAAVVVLRADRANRSRLVAGAGLAFGFLALPTNYRYGFTGMMVPLMWLWLAAYFASVAREGRLRSRADAAWAAGNLLAVFAFTQAFAGIEARHFIFLEFVPVLPSERFDHGPLLFWALVAAGVLAKLFVFFPERPRRVWVLLSKVALIAVLELVQWRIWEPGAEASLGLLAGLLLGWWAARRRHRDLAQACALGLLSFLYVYCVRPPREQYARADCVLAGLVLAARWLRRFPQPEHARRDATVLGAVAVLAAGFFSVSWSIERLEWSRIYTWLPAHVVEAFAVLLVPWIAAKTALPLLIARNLMARELDWPDESLWRLAGFKLLTLLLVLTGLGTSGMVSNVYLEGVQQLTVLLMLWVGLAPGGARSEAWPARALP